MLHEFIAINRDELIGRCRAKVAARSVPPPTESEIDHGVPMFLDQLVEEMRLGLSANPDDAPHCDQARARPPAYRDSRCRRSCMTTATSVRRSPNWP